MSHRDQAEARACYRAWDRFLCYGYLNDSYTPKCESLFRSLQSGFALRETKSQQILLQQRAYDWIPTNGIQIGSQRATGRVFCIMIDHDCYFDHCWWHKSIFMHKCHRSNSACISKSFIDQLHSLLIPSFFTCHGCLAFFRPKAKNAKMKYVIYFKAIPN
jgi:hypothetical protein